MRLISEMKLIGKLLKYDALATLYVAMGANDAKKIEYVKKKSLPSEVMDELKEAGLAFELESITHDQAVQACFDWYERNEKTQVVKSFIASFRDAAPEQRAGLSAFAMMQTMPAHSFDPSPAGFCKICSATKVARFFDRTALNRQRYQDGSMAVYKTPYEIQFFLEQQTKVRVRDLQDEDLGLMQRLANVVGASEAKGPSELVKCIRAEMPDLKLSVSQTRSLVETLGLCGILRSQEHPGYDQVFTNPGLAPSKTHSSDWAYPVDFWTYTDGVNKTAWNNWFSGVGLEI